ncbi:hypothetical protein ZWY2020_042301 [Hordeum vulgare]|nr:hypothetical protein ZWY2020_042301 [Hordeum vulgare]
MLGWGKTGTIGSEIITTAEQNMQTEGLLQQTPPTYEAEVITTLIEETNVASHIIEPPDSGPLPPSAFIEENVPSQPPVQPTTAITQENVHRKREVLALAKLRLAAEKKEIADQAKFDAALNKIREEEQKILQAVEKRKQEAATKKIEIEEKKKAVLREKQLAAEEKKREIEERKRKRLAKQQEKRALAQAKRNALQDKKMQMEEAKKVKATEKKRLADEKRKRAEDSLRGEEMQFLMMQEDEQERIRGFKDYLVQGENSRQQAWEKQNLQQDASRAHDWEERKKQAEKWNKAQAQAEEGKKQATEENLRLASEKQRQDECQAKQSILEQPHQPMRPYFTQARTGFKKPRKSSMFDILK